MYTPPPREIRSASPFRASSTDSSDDWDRDHWNRSAICSAERSAGRSVTTAPPIFATRLGRSRYHEKVLVAPNRFRNLLPLVRLDQCSIELGPGDRSRGQSGSTQWLRRALAGSPLRLLPSAPATCGGRQWSVQRRLACNDAKRVGWATRTLPPPRSTSQSGCPASRHDHNDDCGRWIHCRA